MVLIGLRAAEGVVYKFLALAVPVVGCNRVKSQCCRHCYVDITAVTVLLVWNLGIDVAVLTITVCGSRYEYYDKHMFTITTLLMHEHTWLLLPVY